MKRSNELASEQQSISTLVDITAAFEGISSLRISQIREKVLNSQIFFGDLWRIYRQLRVDELFHFGRSQTVEQPINKEVMILITSEGSFSGDIDQRLIAAGLSDYDKSKNDIIMIGHHGAVQLQQKGVKYVRSFKTPEHEQNINTKPIMEEIQKYRSTVVYYQRYLSLMTQEVKKVHLARAVMELGSKIKPGEEAITEDNYIFEPSTYAVVDHMERSMIQIMIGELILESKLAQYASRFKAMNLAHEKAAESFDETGLLYRRAFRNEKDERLKETINGLRKAGL